MAGATVVQYIQRFSPFMISMILIGCLWWATTRFLLRVDHCYVYPEQLLSDTVLQDIQANIIKTACTKSFSSLTADSFAMPTVIKKFNVLYRHPHAIYVTLYAKQPCARLNQHYYMMQDGSIEKKELFTEQASLCVPEITVHQAINSLTTAEHHALYQWIIHLDPEISLFFDIHWHNHTKIILYHTHILHYALITHAAQVLSPILLSYCSKAFTIKEHKKLTKNQILGVDARFDQQIIVYELPGEKV